MGKYNEALSFRLADRRIFSAAALISRKKSDINKVEVAVYVVFICDSVCRVCGIDFDPG